MVIEVVLVIVVGCSGDSKSGVVMVVVVMGKWQW